MNKELITKLQASGSIDEELVYAEAESNVGAGVLCVNAELVTFVKNDGEEVFKDTVDRLFELNVKNGLFKKTLAFVYNGITYNFTVKGGKKLMEYFAMLAEGI